MPKYANTKAAGIVRACHASALSRYAGAGWASLRAQNHEWLDLSPVVASCLHVPEPGYPTWAIHSFLSQALSDRSDSITRQYTACSVGLNGFGVC
ncbi:hypothetical protein ASPBRDRAFT_373938 [Aspergillus brasiliensis CBS 101740]|uniref:Uncharacterized protein n=1 Tax=Aspergillus brasiliensis (strain CBS 101740 / IMI 381727 / IBT 21946) TaxID=767769 RepID=A0A1L9UV73_ASPBC|nr:hypothetical protein ASPBRDRAFT_373938 [Aspergillus brasiliensis CBS 101740]